MSLRREIHQAFDGIAPPTFGMPERVVQTVLNDTRSRRKGRLMVRLRAPLSLVAVFVAIAVIAALLIGGRVINDWIVFRNGSPAGATNETQVAQLEARPLHIPIPKSPADCTTGPLNGYGEYGSGPIYGIGGLTSASAWGLYYHNFAYADAAITGPILVRSIDVFTNKPTIFVGQFASGRITGTDTVDGKPYQQHVELVFDMSNATSAAGVHRYVWGFLAGAPNGWSGSSGWQIDGVSFTETFVVC